MAEEKELRPIATRVLYEDDEVRIWDQRIGAGETLGRHRHDCDYVIVTVRGGGPIDVEFHDGTGGELSAARRSSSARATSRRRTTGATGSERSWSSSSGTTRPVRQRAELPRRFTRGLEPPGNPRPGEVPVEARLASEARSRPSDP
jgi:hypothetical protein